MEYNETKRVICFSPEEQAVLKLPSDTVGLAEAYDVQSTLTKKLRSSDSRLLEADEMHMETGSKHCADYAATSTENVALTQVLGELKVVLHEVEDACLRGLKNLS
jgi:hypothetical protein